jgi:hypothetical protein
MQKRVAVTLALWLVLSVLSHAQSTDWAGVIQLPAGTVVRLQGQGGFHAQIIGVVQSVDDQQIVVNKNGRVIAVERTFIRRVDRRVAPPDRHAGGVNGFAIGLGAGALGFIGASIDQGIKALPISMAVMSAIGAGLGFATASPKYVLVYSGP